MNQELKRHREKVMMDKEKMLLPDTQIYVEKELEMRNLSDEQKTVEDELLALETQLRMVRRKYINNQQKIIHWNDNHDLTYQQTEAEEQRQRDAPKFVRACPANDCRGFLSSQWKCGLCNVKVCKECHEIKDETDEDAHICVESNVQTARKLMKDTKPCPSCSSMIFKISGCDQMWCTQCHTAFSWRTGNIERNLVHNPHFYEWQRENNGGVAPRVPGDVVCGGLPTVYEITNKLNGEYNSNILMKNMGKIHMFHRIVAHVQIVELRSYHARTDEEIQKHNVAMRIKWMLNEIEEKTWKQKLYYQNKRDKFQKDIYDVFELFSNAGQDLMRRILESPQQVTEFIDELEKLTEYVNTSFVKISKRNKYSTPYIARHERTNRMMIPSRPEKEEYMTIIKKAW